MEVLKTLQLAGGCQVTPLNEKYVGVKGTNFELYLRTENPRWAAPIFRTIFIYGYRFSDEEQFLRFLDHLRSTTQVVLYAEGLDFAKRLEGLGFKETNRFTEVTISIDEELMKYPPSSIGVTIIRGLPSLIQMDQIKSLASKQLSGVRESLNTSSLNSKTLFTWFDSQYCPSNFHVSFEETGIWYAIAKRDGQPVGFSKLLLPIKGVDKDEVIEVELEVAHGCSMYELRSSLFSALKSEGFKSVLARRYDGNPDPSFTKLNEQSMHIMEYGADSTSWSKDPHNTNPIDGRVWMAKRNED